VRNDCKALSIDLWPSLSREPVSDGNASLVHIMFLS
jgi:hypothetical protein